MAENYIYKKEVDWSLLTDGLTIPIKNQVIFAKCVSSFIERGEKKEINLILMGQTYKARIVNVNFNSSKYKRNDIYQIRYSRGSELATALQTIFYKSYNYFINQRLLRQKNDRTMIKLPEEGKEYLVLYTTEYEDTYLIEPITQQEIVEIYKSLPIHHEHILEESINYQAQDNDADIILNEKLVKIRKLNRAIGDNLKLLYNYSCQICGENIGHKYGVYVVEAHHIEYFMKSINNDASNQVIVCPNHHRIIHQANPRFDRNKKIYTYENGVYEGLKLNYHL